MEEKKGIIGEFKEFIMRGNVMDLAVGVIIGAAFQGIINSLVEDVIMPLISLVAGGLDFQEWFISLDGSHYATYAEAKEAGAAVLGYGTFITAVINFLIMAFVIFMLVKGMNRLARSSEEEEAAPETKACPYCMSDIPIDATRCPNCTSQLSGRGCPRKYIYDIMINAVINNWITKRRPEDETKV